MHVRRSEWFRARACFTLTQTRVDESVPNASGASDQPAPLRAGREAERGPEHADQQVAHGDAHQQQVHGRAQSPVPAEQREHQQVAEEAARADRAKAHRHHQVPRGAQGRSGGGARRVLLRVPVTARAAQARVGDDHAARSRQLWSTAKFRDGTIRNPPVSPSPEEKESRSLKRTKSPPIHESASECRCSEAPPLRGLRAPSQSAPQQ